MLDFDLAQLYDTETRALNQAVKRNLKRFPEDFMFRLTAAEWQAVRSQVVTAPGSGTQVPSPIVIASQNKRNASATPYGFTEQGVAMLSGIIHSEKAINMNIAIMRAFVAVRMILANPTGLKDQLQEFNSRLGEHDVQLNGIYDAIENLLDDKAAQKKWEDRDRIGFKKR